MTGVYIDGHVWIHSDNNTQTGLPMKPEKNNFDKIMNAAPVLIATNPRFQVISSHCYQNDVHDIILLGINKIYSRYLPTFIIAYICYMSSIYLLKGDKKMGKNLERQYAFRCDDETIKKLEYIAKQHTRNRNQEMKHIIKQYIDAYEEDNGRIRVEEENNSDN